jgi:hypothetical protein
MARTILSCLGLGLAAAAATGATAAFGGVGVAEAAAFGGVAGNLATELCKVLHRPVAERWLEGRSGIDEKPPVASALRLAQLKALGVVREQFDAAWPVVTGAERFRDQERFSRALKRFLDAETKTAKRAGFRLDPDLGADESVRRDTALRDAVLNALPDVFDESLAARRDRGDDAAIRNSLTQLRTAVENAVLAEIRLRTDTPGEELPDAFLGAFRGRDVADSWFDLFVRDAAFRLKTKPSSSGCGIPSNSREKSAFRAARLFLAPSCGHGACPAPVA